MTSHIENRVELPSAELFSVDLPHWTERQVHSVLGLPIDAVTLEQALVRIRGAVVGRHRLFLSTPNTNFAMAAMRDPVFRRSVQCSDLSVADGMPLIWAARLTRAPIHTRVAGADLFERLLQEPGPPIRVYFFGGPDGAGAAACQAVNQRAGALQAVGYCSPGFGSVNELSAAPLIDAINASGADFIVVSLGAAKGQRWIMANQSRLQAPVLSHLGAVVNFMAGTVRRAPGWLGPLGFEWLWRVAMEPALWRRYAKDGVGLLRQLSFGALAYRLFDGPPARGAHHIDAPVTIQRSIGAMHLTLPRYVTPSLLPSLRAAFREAELHHDAVTLNLTQVEAMDTATLALLQLAQVHLPSVKVDRISPRLKRLLSRLGANSLVSVP